MPSIRGHQGKIKLFKNGGPTGVINILSADVNQDSSFSRSFYVGQTIPEGDQSIEGWSGSMDLEVKDASVDEMIDSIVAGNLAGVGADEMSVLIEEHYPDGTSSKYVYFDCQMKMSKRVGGMNEKQTKRVEFQASGRIAL